MAVAETAGQGRQGALAGVFVLALEQAVAAPLCTVRLADAGARVVKVERPGGETARHYDAAVQGTSAYFAWLNRGKESAMLDLRAPADMALFEALLGRADVLVQNLAPGALARLGWPAERLAARFPRLIVVSIAGYGQDTPCAGLRAYDMLVQAETGLCSVTGTPDTPCKVGVSAADIATGMNAHAAVLEALIARERSGRGAHLEIAMFDSLADWMTVPLLHLEQAGILTGRHGLAHAAIQPYRPFACADGTILIAVQNNAEWERLCAALGAGALARRPEFATNALRVANRAALDAALEPLFGPLPLAEAVERLERARIAWGRLRDVAGLSAHPALRRMEVELPGGGRAAMPRPAGREAGFAPGPVPAPGADTERLRAEMGL